MQDLIVDEEFRFLLPILDKNTYALLEENILENGIRDPIVIWENIIIDGHNRYEVAMKHNIPFNTVSKEFDSRDDVVIWIISTQVSRRNLTPIQLSYYRGLHYKTDKNSRGDSSRFVPEHPKAQNGPLGGSTANRLAKQYRVSRNTIKRDSQVAEAIDSIGKKSPEAKREILSGAIGITKKQLNELLAGSEDEISDIASKIQDGTYDRRTTSASASNRDDGEANHINATKSLNAAFTGITNRFYLELQALLRNYDTAELKEALRLHISILEDMHSRM